MEFVYNFKNIRTIFGTKRNDIIKNDTEKKILKTLP